MATPVVESIHAFDAAVAARREPFKVADVRLAEHGRNEIRLAEQEMPGLMAVRREHAGQSPLAGARVMGSLHMTVQTAVLIETLTDLGADVRWASCNIFSTQDHAAAAVAVGRPGSGGTPEHPRGVPVFAWKGETLPEYWWCTNEAIVWPDGRGPDLVVDDGGDATLLIHKGYEFEQAGAIPAFDPASDPEEWGVILDLLREIARRDSAQWRRIGPRHPRRQRGDHNRRSPPLRDDARRDAAVPGHQRQRLGHQEQVRQHLRLPALASGRAGAGDGRDAGRQGGGGLRLRRGRQGLRAVAARPGLPRRRHRDRSHLRAAGGHGGLPGRHAGGDAGDGRHLHHHHRQPRHHQRRADGPHEGQGHRRQHRPLRQRDRHGRAQELPPASSAFRSSRSTTSGASRTATASSCWPRAGC